MLRRKIPFYGVAPILLAVVGSLYAYDNHAAEDKVQQSVQGKIWNNEDCLKCHTDAATLHLMQDKRGDSTYCQAAFDRLTGGAKK